MLQTWLQELVRTLHTVSHTLRNVSRLYSFDFGTFSAKSAQFWQKIAQFWHPKMGQSREEKIAEHNNCFQTASERL